MTLVFHFLFRVFSSMQEGKAGQGKIISHNHDVKLEVDLDIFEAIETRRSIRHYRPEPVSNDSIERILSAAMMAPSAGNQQPWQFIVIRKRELLDAIPDFHPHAEMVLQVSVAILVCGDLRLENHKGYWVQDCSAATQNLLLAAHGLGLGAVWTGIYPRQDRVKGFRNLLNLPQEVMPLALVPIGYPDRKGSGVERFDRARIHQDGWEIKKEQEA